MSYSMMVLSVWICSVIVVVSIVNTNAFRDGHCDVNRTYVTTEPVEKERLVVLKPTGFFGRLKGKKFDTETYWETEEVVKWHIVEGCCEGYREVLPTLCEPICSDGCPENAKCVAPNSCKCMDGFVAAVNEANSCRPSGITPQINFMESSSTETADVKSTRNDEVDATEKIISSTMPTTAATIGDITESSVECPKGFVPSLKSKCPDNNPCVHLAAICVPEPELSDDDNGSSTPTGIANGSGATQPASHKFENLKELPIDDDDNNHKSKFWWLVTSSVLGGVVGIALLVLIIVKLVRCDKGDLDLEGKTDLYCKYEAKTLLEKQINS